jgi:hypothetical protein
MNEFNFIRNAETFFSNLSQALSTLREVPQTRSVIEISEHTLSTRFLSSFVFSFYFFVALEVLYSNFT